MFTKVNFVEKVLARLDRLDRTSLQNYLTGLVTEKRQLEMILDSVNEGILLLDPTGIVRSANRSAFLWLGFERFFKQHSSILELIQDSRVKEFIVHCLEKEKGSQTGDFEVLVPREMALRIHWVPFDLEGQDCVLVRIEKKSSVQPENSEEAQVQRIEGLTRLAAGVAHEIGNPLNSIQIHLGLLKRELSKLPRTKQKPLGRFVEILSLETKRLDQIVRSFLKATRRPPLRFRKESLNNVVEQAVEFLRPEIKKQGARVRLEFDKNVPAFLLDRDRLHQAFINLIKNALEAMPQRGELTISTGLKDRLCLIRFGDQGEGIDEKDLPHIFEAYYTTKKDGSGLGLTQVYQAIREHGGRIDVKSRPGRGTLFTLILPVRQERLSLPEPEERRRR